MKLSIIIPCYNSEPYIDELINVLKPQLTPEVEVIVIDDGSDFPYMASYKEIKVIRQTNKGQSAARNKGLSVATGEYITFIDSDDLVSRDYIFQIMCRIIEGFDILELSWKSNDGLMVYQVKPGERLSNPSVCTRVFKRSIIGKTKFNEKKDACEDEDFSRRIGYNKGSGKDFKYAQITDFLYIYRRDTPGSNTKRYKQGLCNTKRVVYYFDKVPADILPEIKREDATNEVWLLTNDREINPKLYRYCQISTPFYLWTHFLRGDHYRDVQIITPPTRAQVVLYIRNLYKIGGIETFVYNFVRTMSDKYDIILNCENIPPDQYLKLTGLIQIIRDNSLITCDTLIMLRILDDRPMHIISKQTIRMCHACKTNPRWEIPLDYDKVVFVSEASRKSFGKDGVVIHNPFVTEHKKALFLISATRIPAPDKGQNELRFRILADMLQKKGIPFLWLNFSEGKLDDMPSGFYNMPATADIQPYIARADYLVQLSDSEAYSYSILEALTNDTAVICTPFPSASESGIVDGVNGYIVPFDMSFDVTMLLNVPSFTDDHSNDGIINQWIDLLGKPAPTRSYKPNEGVKIRAKIQYQDTQLNCLIKPNEVYTVSPERANTIINLGYAERI